MAMPEATINGGFPEKEKAGRSRLSEALRPLQRLDVRRGRTLLALRHVEGDLLAVLQRLEAGALDRAVMGEQILAAVIRRDESEALGVVEPLHGTCSHVYSLPENLLLARGCPSLAAGTMIKRELTATRSRFWRR